MHRHAFLIMAHNNWPNLERILRLLDKSWVDFYIHIDKKAKDFDKHHFLSICKNASVEFVRRHDVTWGNESQVKAEMTLFKAAFRKGPYWYYHFLSGSDLPLKKASEIYDFFEDTQENFIQILDATRFEWRLKNYINVFRQSWIPAYFRKKLNILSEIYQYKFKTNRLKWLKSRYPYIAKGHNWCDLTQAAVESLIWAQKDIKRFTRFTQCSDEMYKQIVICSNPELYKTVASVDIRYIKWQEGDNHPQVLTDADFDNMITTPPNLYIFARKFNEDASTQVAERIFKLLI